MSENTDWLTFWQDFCILTMPILEEGLTTLSTSRMPRHKKSWYRSAIYCWAGILDSQSQPGAEERVALVQECSPTNSDFASGGRAGERASGIVLVQIGHFYRQQTAITIIVDGHHLLALQQLQQSRIYPETGRQRFIADDRHALAALESGRLSLLVSCPEDQHTCDQQTQHQI